MFQSMIEGGVRVLCTALLASALVYCGGAAHDATRGRGGGGAGDAADRNQGGLVIPEAGAAEAAAFDIQSDAEGCSYIDLAYAERPTLVTMCHRVEDGRRICRPNAFGLNWFDDDAKAYLTAYATGTTTPEGMEMGPVRCQDAGLDADAKLWVVRW